MSGTNGANPSPDLATILQTLARLAPASQEQGIGLPTAAQQSTVPYNYHATETGYTQNRAQNLSSVGHEFHVSPVSTASSATSMRPPQSRSLGTSTSSPPIDPATIIDWKQGLRCVSSIGSQNEYFKAGVRKAMSDQDKHESMWWNSRLALIESHGNLSEEEISENLREELAAFDRKLWQAQQQMVDSISNDLRRLGVPFFGMKAHLITANSSTPYKATPGKITREELLGLQRRMLQHLQDMYQP